MAMKVQKAPCLEKTGSMLESPLPNSEKKPMNEFDRILATELQALFGRIQTAHRTQLAVLFTDVADCEGMPDRELSLQCVPTQSSKHTKSVFHPDTMTWEFQDLEKRSKPSEPKTAEQIITESSGRSGRSVLDSGIMDDIRSERVVHGIDSMQKRITEVRKSVMELPSVERPIHDNCSVLSRVVRHPVFTHFIAFTIFINVLVIAVQTEWRAQYVGRAEPLVFTVVDMCCNVIFIAELCLKLMVYRLSYFTNNTWRWNVFDLVVCMFAAAEVLAILLKGVLVIPGATLARAFRLVRIVRTVRALRVSRIFTELRTMVHSMVNCLRAFTWLVILLSFVIFACSVFITHGVSDEKARFHDQGLQYDENTRRLDEDFGSLLKSFYTLFKVISDGQAWGLYGDRLLKISKMAALMFMGYIAFVTLAVLNVVTGIFVNFSMKAAEDDIDSMTLEHTSKQDKLISDFCSAFHKADVNQNGMLSLSEFVIHLSDPGVRAYFKFIDLDIDLYSPEKLFKLLDFQGCHNIDLKEFVLGLSKFRGNARALDLAALHSDVYKLDKKITGLFSVCLEQTQDVVDYIHSTSRPDV